MDRLEERMAVAIRNEARALCASCLSELMHVSHPEARHAVIGLALTDEFTYATECARCGRDNSKDLIVTRHP